MEGTRLSGLVQQLRKLPVDGFLAALMATVFVAAILPARGAAAPLVGHVVTAAVALLFFLYGIKLSPAAVASGLAHWRLQTLVFASSFVVFPVIGIIVAILMRPILPHDLIVGLVFVCVLPSTVQSSIAFTSIARGNVPAALCSASVSNLAGMVMTPLLLGLILHTQGRGLSLGALRDIGLQLLLPFVAGQIVRPFTHRWLERRRRLTSIVDRGSILVVVYAAFSEGMVAGIWSQLTLGSLAIVVLLNSLILAFVLALTTIASRSLGFSKEDEIAIVFCGSKKSMAGGIPMANILFPSMGVGAILLPLMLFHQIQLFACAALAKRYARRPPTVPSAVSGQRARAVIA